jgi:glycine cleavage system transcriptional repressor
MPRFSLSALGADRPGIVAAVTGVLVDQGCNLEDSTMTILQGQFAVLLVVSAPDATTAVALEAALAEVTGPLGLVVAVRPLAEPPGGAGTADEGDPWTISIHGADRPGIVHAVALALADAEGNVVDLSTHLIGGPDAPVYVMMLRVTLPAGRAEAALAAVSGAATALGVHCTMHPDESDLL